MVLKLYGVAQSTCTQRVLLTLAETKAEWELVSVDFANREHKSETYLEKQPVGKVPVLDDNGFLVYESRAIARYLARKFELELMPPVTDLKGYALFEQACSIEQSYYDPNVSILVYEIIIKARRGLGPPDDGQVASRLSQLEDTLSKYDVILGKQAFLAGDSPTLADLFHLPFGVQVEQAHPDIFTKHPSVKRWWKALKARKSWTELVERPV